MENETQQQAWEVKKKEVNNMKEFKNRKWKKEIGGDVYLHLSYNQAPPEFLTLRSSVGNNFDVQCWSWRTVN